MEAQTTERDDPRRTNGHDAGHTPLPDPGATMREAEAMLRDVVNAYPLLSLAGALLGGYTLARLLRSAR